MFKIFKGKNREDIQLDMENIPEHIAIIMDGNGRWAKKRKLPRNMGHKAGVEAISKVLEEADKLGVKYITLYAFSTENWKRPKDEVESLMKLMSQYLKKGLDGLNENNVVVKILGDIDALPEQYKEDVIKAIESTQNNTRVVLNIAFNYGGRDEILRATKNISIAVKNGQLLQEDINEDLFKKYLYTSECPDPDLIIRPSGEQRLSNFLLWQCAYSEFWYSNVNWPDFSQEDLREAIYDYQNRDRRYGGV